MTAPTRFNSIGLFGKKGTDRNKFDGAKTSSTIELPIVASDTAQNTNVFLGDGQIVSAYIYTKVAEVTGTTKTVSVGLAGGTGVEILNIAPVDEVGASGSFSPVTTKLADEITYTLGSADFAELEAYLVIEFNGLTEV